MAFRWEEGSCVHSQKKKGKKKAKKEKKKEKAKKKRKRLLKKTDSNYNFLVLQACFVVLFLVCFVAGRHDRARVPTNG